jgi:hypothetical protein
MEISLRRVEIELPVLAALAAAVLVLLIIGIFFFESS